MREGGPGPDFCPGRRTLPRRGAVVTGHAIFLSRHLSLSCPNWYLLGTSWLKWLLLLSHITELGMEIQGQFWDNKNYVLLRIDKQTICGFVISITNQRS